MKRPTILGLAALLLLAAVFPVAANPARAVEPGQAVIDFFVAQGVEAQYVGAAKADVPADVWKKINAIASAEHSVKYDKDANKKIDCCCCELRSHIIADLFKATNGKFDPVSMKIGDSVWYLQMGSSDAAGWVKE